MDTQYVGRNEHDCIWMIDTINGEKTFKENKVVAKKVEM